MMVDKSQFNKDALEFIGRGKDVEELRDNELNRLIALMVTDDFKDFEHASHGPEWSDFMNFRRTKYERNI